MSTTTNNLNLIKPELTDAADITAMNVNWDKIDEQLGGQIQRNKITTYSSLNDIGIIVGSETIENIITGMVDNSMLLTTISGENNTSIYPKPYGTLLVYRVSKHRTMLFYGESNTGVLYYANYYESTSGDTWSGWTTYLSTNGGTVNGNLILTKANNGFSQIYKNHDENNDFGTVVADNDHNGNVIRLVLHALENKVSIIGTDGKTNELYGEHNHDLLKQNISHHYRLYSEFSQIGITEGSETIESIATKLPMHGRLVVTIGGSSNSSIYPNGNYGLLVVEKTINSRILFTFTNNQGTQWIGMYSISSNGNTWTDWMMMYNASRSMVLTYGVHYGTSLPTAGTKGRLFFKKV